VNPLFATMAGILHLLKRKCPKCHREQSVPADKISTPLPCKYCGSIIQPYVKGKEFPARKHKTTLFHQPRKQRTDKIRLR